MGEMETEEILGAVKARSGPDYEEAYSAAMQSYAESHEKLANWQAQCFEQVAIAVAGTDKEYDFCALEQVEVVGDGGTTEPMWCAGLVLERTEAKSIPKRDQRHLQSYGRPYNSKGAPTPTSYYSFAKHPGEVMTER